MARRKIKQWPIMLSCTLALALADSLLLPPPVAACWFGIFGCEPQSVGKARGRTPGKARRDSDVCRPVELPLTALVPDTTEPVQTSVEYPVFWFYLPTFAPITAAATPGKPAIKLKFVLQDEQHRDIYETRFQLPATTSSGLIGLRFLAPDAALAIGKTYRWYFLVYCNDPQELNEPTFVEGVIQRAALSADRQSQIDREDPQKRVLTYAAAGFWYDTLAALQALRSQSGDATLNSNAEMIWVNTLKAVGLPEKIAQQPLRHYYVADRPDNQAGAAPK
jgi:Domain of Unknown Function (DUF928)